MSNLNDAGHQSSVPAARGGSKSPDAFRTISEVAEELTVPPHVLRFWETKFTQIKPLKRGGGRRYYRPEDVQLLRRIRSLLYVDGYTIKGVQRLLKENGVRTAAQVVNVPDRVPPEGGSEAAPSTKRLSHSAKTAAREAGKMSLKVHDRSEAPAQTSVSAKDLASQDLGKALEELKAMQAALAPYRSDSE